MAIALEIGVGNLVAEFLAHTLCILVLFEGARAEAIIVFQCFAHIVNELFVWIDVDFH